MFIAARVLAVVWALLALATLAAACDGSPQPEATPTPGASVVATDTPSPSPATTETPRPTITPSPTATPIPLPSVVAGKPVTQLVPGPPVEFPDDLVLYVGTSRCTMCAVGTGDFWRIYRGRDGQLVADHIQPEEGVTFYAASADAATIIVGICTGYCGGEGPPSPAALMRFVISRDGGITWQPLTSPAFERTDFWFTGWSGDQIVVAAFKYLPGDEVERVDSYLVPSFARLEPPPGLPVPTFGAYQQPYALVGPGGQLFWAMRQPYGSRLLFDEQGKRTSFAGLEAVFPGMDWGSQDPGAARTRFGIWQAYLDRWNRAFLVMVDGGGTPLAGFAANWEVTRASAVSETRFIAAAVLPLAPGEPPPGGDNFRAVLVDTTTGVTRAIKGLPPDDSLLPGRYSWPYMAIVGKFWRVNAGGECLNVRQEASVSSAVLGCFASGVLLREREAEAPAGWQAVATPDGTPGFAASQYLR